MRTLVMATLGLLIVTLAVAQPLKLAAAPIAKGQSARTFASFFARFKAAVASGDKEAIASMTQLPFLLEGEQLDRAAFIEKFDTLFDKQVKRCFARSKPVRDAEYYELACGGNSFMFKKVNGQYEFVEIGVND